MYLESFKLYRPEELKFYCNYRLKGKVPPIRKVICYVHGTNRNATDYFKYLEDTDIPKDTLIIAPFFPIESDKLESTDMYWSSGGWKRGDKCKTSKRVSSFQVLHELISSFKFTDLKEIMIVGHSAGGQFVQRLALGGYEDPRFNYTYVVMNPSSYCYIDGHRLKPITGGTQWNEYKYGMEDRNSFMREKDSMKMVVEYLARNVYIALGEDDVKSGGTLDENYEAMCQGDNRLERGKLFFQHMNNYAANNHKLMLVPGVGHSGSKMIQSPQLVQLIRS